MAIISCQRLVCTNLEVMLVGGHVQMFQGGPWRYAPKLALAKPDLSDAAPQHEDAVGGPHCQVPRY